MKCLIRLEVAAEHVVFDVGGGPYALADRNTDNKLTIVTFNYDRSLEQYLGRALSVAGAKDIRKRLSLLGFIHVYGTLGGRPYIDENPLAREYGDIKDPSAVKQAADGIKIIDREDDGELLSQFELAKNALSDAKNIVILGFGYDATNVRRLALRESIEGRDAGVLGTAWGMSKRQRQEVEGVVQLKHQFRLEDTNCLGLFENHFGFR